MTLTKELKEQALCQMIEKGIIPQILYKYREDGEYTEKIFKDKTLWFEHPNKFNDPFDCWANVVEPSSEGIGVLIASSSGSSCYKKICSDGAKLYTKKMLKSDTDNALSEIGVCCFSKSKDNILMWSHYSDYHKGLCLEFDVLKDPTFFTLARPVLYMPQMPEYDHFNERKKLIEKIIQPKADFWKYEKEVRVIKTLDDISNNNGQAFKFGPKALTKVILGCKMDASTIEKYRRLCNVPEFKHVKFSQMQQMDNGTFGLKEVSL